MDEPPFMPIELFCPCRPAKAAAPVDPFVNPLDEGGLSTADVDGRLLTKRRPTAPSNTPVQAMKIIPVEPPEAPPALPDFDASFVVERTTKRGRPANLPTVSADIGPEADVE